DYHSAEYVQRLVGAYARSPVLDDEDGHRRRDDPGHRADSGVVMARIEAGGAACRPAFRLLPRPGEPLVDERPDDGAPQRAAHALPLDRRASVEDGGVRPSRDDVDGGAAPPQGPPSSGEARGPAAGPRGPSGAPRAARGP